MSLRYLPEHIRLAHSMYSDTVGHLRGGAAGECAVRRMHCGDPVADTEPVAEASEADSAEMITKREVGRFRQVKSKKDVSLGVAG